MVFPQCREAESKRAELEPIECVICGKIEHAPVKINKYVCRDCGAKH